jgi:hypothetical protein
MPEKKKPARTVYQGKYFRVRMAGKRDYVERINLSGVVTILALTADGKIILTEQWREPVGKRVVALAAGLAGDEKRETSARRGETRIVGGNGL